MNLEEVVEACIMTNKANPDIEVILEDNTALASSTYD